LLTGGVTCIRDDQTIEIQRALPRGNQPSVWAYVNLTCGTELKWRSLGFYIMRMIYIIVASMYMMANKQFVSTINRYEALALKERVKEFVVDYFIRDDVDYRQELKKATNFFMRWKVSLLIVYIVVWVSSTIYSFTDPDTRAIVLPFDNYCGGEGEKGDFTWNREREIQVRCHFNFEYAIFFFLIASEILKVGLVILFLLSVIFLQIYRRRVSHL
jgi:hypothetical protein